MIWKNWGITPRVITIAVLPLLVMFLALLSYSYYSRLNEVEEELQERGQLAASLLAESSEYGLISGDLTYLNPTIQSLLQLDNSILSVDVLDAAKRPLLHIDRKPSADGNSREFETPVKRALVAANPFIDRNAPHVGDQLASELSTKSQQVIGHVRITTSAIDMLAKQRHRVRVWTTIALAILTLAVLLGLGLAMSLTKPLAKTVAAVRAIRGGNHATNITVSTGGEIGELQSSIQEMALRLSDFARDLETKVAERTHDLAAARDEALKLNAERVKLIQKVTSAVEEERREIATELHDHLNAQLIVIRLTAQRIARAVDSRTGQDAHQEIKDAAESIVRFTSDLYVMSRQIARMLRPEILDTLGLQGAIEEMIRHYNALHSECTFRFHQEGESAPLGEELSIAAYRLTQEALSNVVKHANAKVASVGLEFLKATLKITVCDDGQGFDTSETEPGIGLIGMRERVNSLDGRLNIVSVIGSGTTIIIELPVHRS